MGKLEASKKPARSQQEARKRPARGQQEASKRPARGQQEVRKRPARGQQEARNRPARGQQEASKRPARGQDKKLARAKRAWGTSGCGLGFRALSIHVFRDAHLEFALARRAQGLLRGAHAPSSSAAGRHGAAR